MGLFNTAAPHVGTGGFVLPQIFTAGRTAHLPSTNESSRKEIDTPYYAFVPGKIHPSTPPFADGPASELQGILSRENNSRIGLPVSRAAPVLMRPRTRMRSSGLSP